MLGMIHVKYITILKLLTLDIFRTLHHGIDTISFVSITLLDTLVSLSGLITIMTIICDIDEFGSVLHWYVHTFHVSM